MSQWALLSAVLRNRMFPKDHAVKQSMATYSKVFQPSAHVADAESL